MHDVCDRVGLPIEHEKDEGSTTNISFVRIKLDSVAVEIWLPQDKLMSVGGSRQESM